MVTAVVLAEERPCPPGHTRRRAKKRGRSRSPPSGSPSRPQRSAQSGTRLEIRLESDDTAHGFHIVGTDVDIELPKRGRGTATVTFSPRRAATRSSARGCAAQGMSSCAA